MRSSPTLHALLALLCAVAATASPAAAEAPVPAASAVPTGAAQDLLDEAVCLHGLRRLLHQEGTSFSLVGRGWRDGERLHHCEWHGVDCSEDGHVISIERVEQWAAKKEVSPASGAGTQPSRDAELALLACLPSLRRLLKLRLLLLGEHLGVSLPQDWVLPGAFPRLELMELDWPILPGTAPLPDIPPGALPALQHLNLVFEQLASSLPASWGSSPAVLPSLQYLGVQLHVVQGGLPLQWAAGFPQLTALAVGSKLSPSPSPSADAAGVPGWAAPNPSWVDTPAPATAQPGPVQQQRLLPRAPRLPVEWTKGFQQLELIEVAGLGLVGSLPAPWTRPGSFPRLYHLGLRENFLTGSLPPDLFANLPSLLALSLANNLFTGTLPASWRNSSVEAINLSNNRLSGPAFPPAWLNSSMPHLEYLFLSNNAGLGGTLPPTLPFTNLVNLAVDGTAVSGTIPAGWCEAPFAKTLTQLYVGQAAIDHTMTLPRCAATSILHVDLCVSPESGKCGLQSWPRRGHAPAVLPEGQPIDGARVGLAAAAAAACLSLAGLAGRVLLRRRRRTLVAQALERQRLLLPAAGKQLQQGAMQSDDGVELMRRWPPQPPASLVRPVQQRGRLAALLSRALGSTGTVSVLDNPLLEAGRGGVAHQLGPALQVAGAEAGSGEEAGSGAGAGLGCAGPASLRWGLPTESLRVPAGAVEFVTDSKGDLVEVGCGGHASVFLARLHPGGNLVAVKVFELEDGADSARVWREVAILRRCSHPRVVPLLGVMLKGRLLLLAMPLMPKGSLLLLLESPQHQAELRWAARGRQIALDVAEALDHLHTQLAILHSDIKPGNVLLSADWRASLSDFGVALTLGTTCARTAAGLTRVYAAPEQLIGQQCGLSADVYSFGLLLVVLLTGQKMTWRGVWRLPRAPEECPQAVMDLINDCLSLDPAQRPRAAEVLERLQAAR